MSYAKLMKKNINISPSIAYQRPVNKIYIGGDSIRNLKKGDSRSLSTVR